ncbi:MAG: hypothetical protein Q8L56_12680, partial [Rhodocyclaceae bacterium]|nr:hypothetical protein [Rhodocyclaceae bacterium]
MNDAPSMSAPRQDDDPAMGDWANALEARGRPPRVIVEVWSRRRLALIFIVVALLFPFYQY